MEGAWYVFGWKQELEHLIVIDVIIILLLFDKPQILFSHVLCDHC